MAFEIREARPDEIEDLLPLLLLAEESPSALRWSLRNMSDAVYRMDEDGRPVGAATMQWRGDPCEILEMGIAPERQGQGLGRQLVAWLVEEARRRGKREMVVGTPNTSVENFLFYQKCGFRMDSVRQDYFWYYGTPVFRRGIRVQDLLVFRRELSGGGSKKKRR